MTNYQGEAEVQSSDLVVFAFLRYKSLTDLGLGTKDSEI